ncbi:MAG: FHA domain-containing protein [Planctomycetes bacterium]|jgi:hypothetical protein|nr:FHA domain-containing protein [Phycisphaerae bacterium]NBB96167.1 FHA domain-containing protein [Planctomycetota bacterium]
MAGVRPELIFVSGPQKHERAVLMNNEVIAGRSPRADVIIREPYVSRQQMKFTLIPDGWVVESISDRRIVINGKGYRRGKQILLASGDVITCGQESELLFVAANDDPGEVLGAYRAEHPDTPSAPTPHTPPAEEEADDDGPPTAPVPVEEPEVFSFDPERRQQQAEPEEPEASEEEVEAAKRKKRMRLYLLAFGVYAMLMLVVMIGLAGLKGERGPEVRSDAPRMLTEDDVRDALTTPLERSPNAEASSRELQRARQYYLQRNARDVNRYLTVKHYRLYRAFRRPADRIFLPQDERKYRDVLDELTERIMRTYRDGYAFEKAGRWSRALSAFNEALDYVPSADAYTDLAVKRVIIQNIRDHMAYVSKQMGEKDD